MKPHPTNGVMRKVLRFLHISSQPHKKSVKIRSQAEVWYVGNTTPPRYSAAGAPEGDLGAKGEHLDEPPQYGLGDDSCEKPTLNRSQIEYRIIKLWKKVWLSLYQIDDNENRYHVERIEALSLGAGLTRTNRLGELHILRRHFLRNATNNGIASLKLFPDLCLLTLLSVVQILEAYESEIENMKTLYSILRSGQLALNESGDLAQVADVRTKYMAIAKPMEKRIKQYDIRMNVLNMDICDEAMDLCGQPKGEYIFYKSFPNMW